MSRSPKTKPVIGWREWVELPEMCGHPIKAKIDTGAATSSLHAFNLKVTERDGLKWARFEIHPVQRSRRDSQEVVAPVSSFRRVRSSSGHSERRPVIVTVIRIGDVEFNTEVTLASRDEMGFRMLLGRAALRRRYVIDPARSYVQSVQPPRRRTK